MTMTDSIIHEIDTSRWLLGEEIVAVQVIPPKRTPKAYPHLQDPQFAAFTTESGVLSAKVDYFLTMVSLRRAMGLPLREYFGLPPSPGGLPPPLPA